MVDDIENWNRESSALKNWPFSKLVILNIGEVETVTSGLCYIEDLTFLENNVVWFWNSLDVQSTVSSVEFYRKKYIIQKKL